MWFLLKLVQVYMGCAIMGHRHFTKYHENDASAPTLILIYPQMIGC